MTQAELQTLIDEYITTNEDNDITGGVLNSVLQAIASMIGVGYDFMGIATPSTNPGTPPTKVVYVAGAGTYPNFGNTAVERGHLGVFSYDTTWHYDVIESGAWFDAEEYPQEAALEIVLYDDNHLDGVPIKINKDVSNLGNSPLEAISAWWAAKSERRLNLIQGYDIEFPTLNTSPATLGPFKAIEPGQFISSITGASSLIFGTTDADTITVDASALPYVATKTLQNVKLASGTASNVKIHVDGVPNGSVTVSQNTLSIGSEEVGELAGQLIENPEWVKVVTDSEGRILYGVKTDGKFYFGDGCPPQIVEYVTAQLEELEGDFITLLNEKVDKVAGKSLIDKDYANAQQVIENPEWLRVVTDSKGRILEGIRKNGEKYVAKEKEKGIKSYTSIREAAKEKEKRVFKVGNTLFGCLVSEPHIKEHKQDAYPYKYYDANSTLAQYSKINQDVCPPLNIANKVAQEEIDFAPTDNTRTRIIVGKDSKDRFFFANIRCEFGDGAGDVTLNCLEVSDDFVHFQTIFKSADDTSGMSGLTIQGCRTLSIKSVKEFANGDFLVASTANYAGAWRTVFFLLTSDFSSITPIECTYIDGTVGLMTDEFAGNVYDWHMDIKGSKAIVTTYGNRNPDTDKGRVWYSEDNGVTWKQVFQMTNHYQDGVEGEIITRVHVHGVMLDEYAGRMFVIAGESNSNLFWSDKGINTTDTDWNVIPIRRQIPLKQQVYMQVVNGFAFEDNLVFGSDNQGAGAFYRLNKLVDGNYSDIQVGHEVLPNKFDGTYYCAAEMFRRDKHTPLFLCITHENCMLTEADNELLNRYNKARVVATYDGFNMVEIWEDDTYGEHFTYIEGEGATTRNFSYCTRGMNFYLLNNGNAVIKYSGRTYNYFGGNPMYSVEGNSKGSCKVKILYNIEKYL